MDQHLNSTNSTENVLTNSTVTINPENEVIDIVCFFVKIIIISVGVLGNTISIGEFLKYRGISSSVSVSHYLIFLAIADNTVLLSEVPIWVYEPPLDYSPLDSYDWLCRLTYFLKYTARLWSASLTLTVTVERYLFVAHPLRRNHFQNKRIYRILIPLTLLLSGTIVLYAPFVIKVQERDSGTRCLIDRSHRELFRILDLLIVRVIGDVIIGIFMVLFTVLCTNVLRRAERLRQGNLQEMSSLSSSGDNQINRIHHQREGQGRSRESQVTKMLLMIPVMFLLFKIPYTVSYYCSFNLYKKDSLSFAETVTIGVRSITEAMSLISYAFNFFVYMMLIPSFRLSIYECCCGLCKR